MRFPISQRHEPKAQENFAAGQRRRRWESPSAIIELVAKKPSAKILPDEAKGAIYIFTPDGYVFIVATGDTLEWHSPAQTEGQIRGAFKNDVFKAKREAITHLQGALANMDTATRRHIADSIPKFHVPTKTVESAPGIGILRVEQPAIDETIVRATEVMGSRDEAMRWLGAPVRALNFATPISILGTKDGVERINDVLGQMEYGIW